MSPMIAELQSPLILLGDSAGTHVSGVIKRLNCRHPLLVTGPDLVDAGLISQVQTWLEHGGIAFTTWSHVEPEPSTDSVLDAVETCKISGCDLVLGVGGGSAIDTAKMVSVLVSSGGMVEDYLGHELIEHRGLPTVMMPTTSGTGAEVTQNALFYVSQERAKQAVVSRHLIPDAAIVDPRLTLTLPAPITAATGFDALCHAIESYTGKNARQIGDMYALEAVRLISTHLRTAVHNGELLHSREAMASASLYAGLAISTAGTNGVHALAYPLQGLHRVTHGVANAVLLPYVMTFNMASNIQRFAEIADAMGVKTNWLSTRQVAEAGVEEVRQLSADIGLPQSLSALGVKSEQISELVVGALDVERLLVNNPRHLGSAEVDLIYRSAM